ncbi:hypothetical protein HMN09_00823700 [Mycena chlorophos]|uniref:Uncharacterized protein n=1 Tax=Mycena chlorophos TaxID=658473 RepID=A0A8H6SVZ8_MYCCL|nr:hypothetical protein HMN09_00823700 [Mycena chlorophos]
MTLDVVVVTVLWERIKGSSTHLHSSTRTNQQFKYQLPSYQLKQAMFSKILTVFAVATAAAAWATTTTAPPPVTTPSSPAVLRQRCLPLARLLPSVAALVGPRSHWPERPRRA